MTLIERPLDASGIGVLSLRVGLAAARALDRFAAEPVRVKWPNDLYVDDGKLAGILVEARWREQAVEWVAIGLGINVRQPEGVDLAAGLEPGSSRLDVLSELIPAVRVAAQRSGTLSAAELEEFNARDLARGRECVEPALGRVAGITADGELLVALADAVAPFRSGSLVLQDMK
jgi:BirA family biotin operon repressor/biotin-[acetyl-CoA-carboxylase] ligase